MSTSERHHPLTAERLEAALVAAGLEAAGPVVAVEPLGGEWAPVSRVTLAGDDEPSVVVVKTRRVDGAGWGGKHHLRREAVALEPLAEADVTVPRLLGFDDTAGVVVMADVGAGPTLEDVLTADDADAARVAFVALAAEAGRLHAATTTCEDAHRARLAALGTDARRDRLGQWPGVTHWDEVIAATADLDFPPAERAADDVALVASELADPGPWGALVHLDLGPNNVVLTFAGRVALVDFEGSTFGHVGLDAAFLAFPFPNSSAHYGTVPPAVVEEALAAYRSALATAVPAAADDAAFRRMLAVGAAGALCVRVLRLPTLAAPGQSTHDSWRRRVQLVQQVEVFVELASAAGALPALASWFDDLAGAMRRRWPDAVSPPAPRFPAFARWNEGAS
jgi:tRNA A-37 threonylcarbamoyl transferase component Bud32